MGMIMNTITRLITMTTGMQIDGQTIVESAISQPQGGGSILPRA